MFVTGCASESEFILYVSDQSYELSPVDIKVYIDDKLVIDDNFEVGNQHNWESFDFKLKQGKHTIKAVTAEGIVFEDEFTVLGKRWAVLNYWKDSTVNKFTFDIQISQPMFM